MIKKEEIKKIVKANWQWQIETIYKKSHTGNRKPPKPKLPVAAAEKEIAAFEKKQGWQFPPSYRTFLRVYNGWLIFDGGSRYNTINALTGVSGPLTRRVQNAIRTFTSYQEGRKYFGVEMAGGLFFFVPNKKSSRGEMRVCHSYFHFKPRLTFYKDFPTFLKKYTHYKDR